MRDATMMLVTYCGAISNGTIPLTAVPNLATSSFTPFACSFDRLLPSGNLRSLDSCGGWNITTNSSELISSSTLFARIPMCFVTDSRILSSVSVHTPTCGGFDFPRESHVSKVDKECICKQTRLTNSFIIAVLSRSICSSRSHASRVCIHDTPICMQPGFH